MEFGDWGWRKEQGGSSCFLLNTVGQGQGALWKAVERYKEKGFGWLWEENSCQDMSVPGAVSPERKERIPKMKRKNAHEMGLCYFLNMSFKEGFWKPHQTPFTDYLQCVLIFNPQLLKTTERNLCSGCSFVKDPGVRLLINLLVIFTQNLIF